MINRLFDQDNLFWRIMARGVDFVGLGLLWVFLCFGIVTIGPATSALYYTVYKVFRKKEDGAFLMMLKSFKDNLRQGIPLSLLVVGLFALMSGGYWVMSRNWSTNLGAVMFVIYYIILVIPAGFIMYLFPIMGRFEMKTADLIKTAVTLCIRHLPSTIVIVLLNLQLIFWTLEMWFPVIFTPVLGMLLSSLFFERIFNKYAPVGDEEEEHKAK